MKRAFLFHLTVILLLAGSLRAWALINPEDANQPVPDWMARIYVIDEFDDAPYFFCYGALTGKDWVMSAGGCFLDPYYVLESVAGPDEPKFEIRIGTSSKRVIVSDYYFSDDSQLVMFQLEEEVTNQPLKQSSLTAVELLNQNVRILAEEESIAVGHSFYNPAGGKFVTCEVNGVVFTDGLGSVCYVFTYPTIAASLQQTRAIVIDPKSPFYPATALDRAVTFDTTGAKIYLDFRQQNSYPCMEDVGLPVIRNSSTATTEMVGIVGGAGVTAGVLVCTPALANEFLAIAYYKDFIEKTMIAADFNKLCPAPPELQVTYTGGNGIRLDWDEVSNADGYRLQYASRIGYSTIQTVEMHDARSISTDINPALQYTVAVMAYNSNCTSQLSEPLPVSLNRNVVP